MLFISLMLFIYLFIIYLFLLSCILSNECLHLLTVLKLDFVPNLFIEQNNQFEQSFVIPICFIYMCK